MPDLDTPLDRSIRDLVARAVSDAPPPPTFDERTAARIQPDDPRTPSRWIVGGLAGISIAAALVAIVLFSRPDERAEPTLPGTEPVAPTSVPTPTTTAAGSAVTATSEPRSTAAPTTPPTTSTTTSTTTTTVPLDTEPAILVAAGPDGVTLTGGGGVSAAITADPMAFAVHVADGRTFVQRSSDQRDPEADTTILVAEPGQSELIGQPVPVQLAGRQLRLHDAATVDSEVVLLVEVGPPTCVGFEGCDGSLWALWADSGRIEQLATRSVWEGGWSGLTLAATGLVVGTQYESVVVSPYSTVLPGSTASPVDFSVLGLEPGGYADCSTCPEGFTVDRTGSYVAWIEGDLDTGATTLAIGALDGATPTRVALADENGDPCCLFGDGPLLPISPELRIADAVADPEGGALSSARAVINPGTSDADRPALLIETTDAEAAVRAAPAGVVLTFGN